MPRLAEGKHGVTFQEATSALRDVFSATAHDPDHSDNEERFVTFLSFPRSSGVDRDAGVL